MPTIGSSNSQGMISVHRKLKNSHACTMHKKLYSCYSRLSGYNTKDCVRTFGPVVIKKQNCMHFAFCFLLTREAPLMSWHQPFLYVGQPSPEAWDLVFFGSGEIDAMSTKTSHPSVLGRNEDEVGATSITFGSTSGKLWVSPRAAFKKMDQKPLNLKTGAVLPWSPWGVCTAMLPSLSPNPCQGKQPPLLGRWDGQVGLCPVASFQGGHRCSPVSVLCMEIPVSSFKAM